MTTIDQVKVDRFTALKNGLVVGVQNVNSGQIFDMVNAINTCLSDMENAEQDESDPVLYDRLSIFLAEMQDIKQQFERPPNTKPYGVYK